jgi:nucleotide-binding universal stress UspA family protein
MAILTAVDFSNSTNKIIEIIKKLARSLNAKVWIVHVAEPDPDFVGFEAGPQTVRDEVARKFNAAHKFLQHNAEELRAEGIDCTALLLQGPTVETIIKEAEKHSVEMIVVGSHGKGVVKRIFLGSTSKGLLRHSSLPVLVVPTGK